MKPEHRKSAPLPNPVEEPFIGVNESAAILGVGPGVVYDLVKSGELESVRIGRLIRIPTSSLHKLAGTAPAE